MKWLLRNENAWTSANEMSFFFTKSFLEGGAACLYILPPCPGMDYYCRCVIMLGNCNQFHNPALTLSPYFWLLIAAIPSQHIWCPSGICSPENCVSSREIILFISLEKSSGKWVCLLNLNPVAMVLYIICLW